jgi:hypothetical protein
MRRTLRILPAIAAIAVGSMLIAAQDDGAKPQMSLIFIQDVKPSMAMQYEAATKEMCELLTEHKADSSQVSFFTLSGPELGYVFVIPLPDGFSSMDAVHDNWMQAVDSIGSEKWLSIQKRADACVESTSMIHSVYREDLSYVPATPSVKQEDIGYANYEFLYTFSGQEAEFAAIAKEWKALYEKNGIKRGWIVYQQVTGDDLPLFLIAEVAKSEADYYETSAKIREKLGEAGQALGMKSSKVIRKVEQMSGRPRPDLSYPMMSSD